MRSKQYGFRRRMRGGSFAYTRGMAKQEAKRGTARIRAAFAKARAAFSYLSAKKYTTLAGTLTFFLVLSVVPFLFWLTLLFGKLNIDFEELLSLPVFNEVREIILYFQESARAATAGASVVLLATTLYSSTNLFYHMRRSGEIIYEYKRRKGSVVLRLSALVLLFLLMLLFLSGVGVYLAGNVLIRRLFPSFVAQISLHLLAAAAAFGLLLLLNLYICPYRMHVKDVLWGSLLSLVLGGVASFGFSVYTRLSSAEKLYGAAVLFILFLLWMYVLMTCFVIGVILNCKLAEKSGRQPKSKRF